MVADKLLAATGLDFKPVEQRIARLVRAALHGSSEE